MAIGSIVTGGSGIAAVVDDTTPQLGGDLDLNGKGLDFPTTPNITDVLDEDDMASDSATKLATQQSIKAYVDGAASGMTELVQDLTPQLGGDLDLNTHGIDFPTTPNITDCLDEDNMASNSATKLATQQSIKAYVDNFAGSANILTVGTVGTGTWQGTDVGVEYGGTGASTLTDHGVLVGSGTAAVTPLAVGTDGQVLVGSSGADPVFATITDGEGITTTLGAGTLQIDCEDASDTNKGIAELAIASEVNTGTDAGRVITPDALAGSNLGTKNLIVKVIADDTDLTTGDNKTKVVIPAELAGMNLVSVGLHVYTVSSSGAPTVMIHNATDAADMLSTALSVDVSELDSKDATTPAVINTGADDVVEGDEIRIDVDTAGTGTKGCEVRMGFRLP